MRAQKPDSECLRIELEALNSIALPDPCWLYTDATRGHLIRSYKSVCLPPDVGPIWLHNAVIFRPLIPTARLRPKAW